MSVEKFRGLALACSAAMMLRAMPGEGKACCFLDGLFGGCCGGAAQTTYAPPYSPRTRRCIRAARLRLAVFELRLRPPARVAVRALRDLRAADLHVPAADLLPDVLPARGGDGLQPGTTCSPCGGCCTSYYPATAWSYQPCLVPYTSYRVVYSNPCVSAGELRAVRNGCGCCGSGCGTCGAAADSRQRLRKLRQRVRHGGRMFLLWQHHPQHSGPIPAAPDGGARKPPPANRGSRTRAPGAGDHRAAGRHGVASRPVPCRPG